MTPRLLVPMTFLGAVLIGLAMMTAFADPASTDAGVMEAANSAPSEVVNPVEADPMEWGVKLYNAIKTGDYWYALGIAFGFLTLGFRMLMSWRKWEWFSTDAGGVASVGITSLLSLLAVSLVAMEEPSWPLAWAVLAGTFTAMGGYTGVKKLVLPLIKKARA